MNHRKENDPFLDGWLARYDRWLAKGEISHSSRVIPLSETFSPKQWVQPTVQAMGILRQATSIAVQPCECRTHYARCDHPVDVCLMLNTAADRLAAKGKARLVDLDAAQEILKRANASGLVHLGIYMPDHEMYGLCSCCPCCCHDLQLVKHYGRADLMARSDYVARTNEKDCTHCGECIPHCAFDARMLQEGRMVVDESACFGCGLCLDRCPVEAISLVSKSAVTQ